MAELHVGEFLGGLNHEVLMTKAVGKDDVAAFIHQLGGGVVALLSLGDVLADNDLVIGKPQFGLGSVGGVDEVQVIGGVFVMQEDKADFKIRLCLFAFLCFPVGAGSQGAYHDQAQEQGNQFLHENGSSLLFLLLSFHPLGCCNRKRGPIRVSMLLYFSMAPGVIQPENQRFT